MCGVYMYWHYTQDVRALIPNEQLLNNAAAETFREYNTEQMIQVQSPHNKHQV